MPDNDSFWKFYWETRLQPMETLGKREAILEASRLIRERALENKRPLRLLELGCGEGQVIGSLLDAHSQQCDLGGSLGVDYHAPSLDRCRRDYPGLPCLQGDFTDPVLINRLGSFDLLLLVNALHEVFSDALADGGKSPDIPGAQEKVRAALALAAEHLAPDGWLVLFDGLEPEGDLSEPITVRFLSRQARRNFESFSRQYRPLKIVYRQEQDPLVVTLSRRDFTRYITKSIFLGKKLWESERLQSYQYFTATQHRAAVESCGLYIETLRTLTINAGKWQQQVEILTPGEGFPAEHILICAHKPAEAKRREPTPAGHLQPEPPGDD